MSILTADLFDHFDAGLELCKLVSRDFSGVAFRPGEWIYADADGVALSPRELSLPETS